MPRTTNPQATKLYRSLTKAYTALAEIFKDGVSKEISAQRLLLEIEAGQNLWQEVCELISFSSEKSLSRSLANF